VLSAVVDNIPYVATMSPVVAGLVHSTGGGDQSQVLWWSLALGAGLGGNATAVGASANVVVIGIAARSGTHLVLAVHQIRASGRRDHRRPHDALPVAALLPARLTAAARKRAPPVPNQESFWKRPCRPD
jgi:hypothetical protein